MVENCCSPVEDCCSPVVATSYPIPESHWLFFLAHWQIDRQVLVIAGCAQREQPRVRNIVQPWPIEFKYQ